MQVCVDVSKNLKILNIGLFFLPLMRNFLLTAVAKN